MSEGRADPRVEHHAERLRSDGVTAVDGYLATATCDEWRRAVETALPDLPRADQGVGYGKLVARETATVLRRSGERDDGMLDVFHADDAVPSLRAFRKDDFVAELITEAAGEPYTPDTCNVCVNRSVTDTRGFHADTNEAKCKSFLYLTDVPDESYGPFAYVPGSHDRSSLARKAGALVNRLRDRPPTDAVLYDEREVVTYTAQRGTLIVADQTGYHRGIPQAEGRERLLVTTAYTPES